MVASVQLRNTPAVAHLSGGLRLEPMATSCSAVAHALRVGTRRPTGIQVSKSAVSSHAGAVLDSLIFGIAQASRYLIVHAWP